MVSAESVQRIFREALAIEVASTDQDLVADGLLDSLALVTLLFEMEQEFGVAIPLDELEIDRLRTIDSIVAFIAGLGTVARG